LDIRGDGADGFADHAGHSEFSIDPGIAGEPGAIVADGIELVAG